MWKIERITKKGQYDYAVMLDRPDLRDKISQESPIVTWGLVTK